MQKLDEVEITGKYENAVGVWDAASQGAVTGEDIERRPLSRPGDVLEVVPGMIVSQHSGDGKANQYFLRGYNLDHGTDFATWVAGMPVNMPTHAHGQGYTDLNFLIPELVSRVVYNKGPYFAEDGDFASVGSARISYAEQLPAAIASLTGGDYGYKRALLAGSPQAGAGRIVYGLEYQYSNGPWDNPEKFHKLNGVLRYAEGSLSNGFNVTAMAYSANWNATDQVPQRAVQSGLIDRFGAVDAERRRAKQPLQPVRRMAPDRRQREPQHQCLCNPLPADAEFEFHLLSRQPGAGRPVRAEREPHRRGRDGEPDLDRQVGRPRGFEYAGFAVAPRPPLAGRALQHAGPRGVCGDEPGRGDRHQCERRIFQTPSSGPTGCAPSPACASTTRPTT